MIPRMLYSQRLQELQQQGYNIRPTWLTGGMIRRPTPVRYTLGDLSKTEYLIPLLTGLLVLFYFLR